MVNDKNVKGLLIKWITITRACCFGDWHIFVIFYFIATTVFFTHSLYSTDEGDVIVNPVLVLSNPSVTDITVQMFNTDGSATGKY